MADWLADAVLYEIYPQSFADSNGDGIGDLRGVIDHLDHLSWLGVTAIWFNPLFASPFVDAGYDVSDYLQVAPRYGTNDDLVELVAAARERGIRVLLDLVAGHTSVEHAWFRAELAADGPGPLGDRYVWADAVPFRDTSNDTAGTPSFVPSPGPRGGYYLKNFFDAQPALNFGYARLDPAEPWRQPVDAPGPLRNRQALKDVMAYWLDRGVAGFRVDMAFSLVKDDPDKVETTALWREIRDWLDATYPDAVIVPEGREPRTAARLAFHADFFLVIYQEHASLFDNGGAGELFWGKFDHAFFDADGLGTAQPFLGSWESVKAEDPERLVLMSSADHDYSRLACGSRTAEQLGAAFTFLLTWGTVPCIYFGDEIGMRYLEGLPDVEGSICNPTYNRAGCRTPMQWDSSSNAGFSTAEPGRLYLPVDPDPARPTVAAQRDDPGSVLHLVRELVALRRATPALSARESTRLVHAGYPLAYVRGGTHLVVVNPRREPAVLDAPECRGATLVHGRGAAVTEDGTQLDGFGHAVLTLAT